MGRVLAALGYELGNALQWHHFIQVSEIIF
jgi:hypothetical protein